MKTPSGFLGNFASLREIVFFFVAAAAVVNAQQPPPQLPEGEGKKVVEKICLDCHGAETFIHKKLDKEGWEKVIASMIERGANGTDAEFDTVVAYLAKNFPKDSK
jgi:mono/diheme cytochrome c family protein